MLAARTAAKVFAGNEDFTRIGRIVEHERYNGLIVGIVTPVAEKIFAETVAGGRLQETGGNNLVSVHVFNG